MQITTFRTVFSRSLHGPAKFCRNRLNGSRSYCMFSIPTVGAVSHLHDHAKCRRDQTNGSGNIANFRFPIWRTSAILNFPKYVTFNFPRGLRPQFAWSCKISSWSDERLRRYSDFLIFNMTVVRHCEFWKHANFNFWHGLQPHSAWSSKIWSTLVERLRRYCEFSISNMAAVHKLDICKI